MDSVKEWKLVNNNCDEVRQNPLLRAFHILNQRSLVFFSLINVFFSPSARRCMGSHLLSISVLGTCCEPAPSNMASIGWPSDGVAR
jgi:hypothetical protein